jgi:uncharacterized LabA/DUF88 family protein
MQNNKRRICIFYDGYSFKLTSDFYGFDHPIRQRIDFNGLDLYIQNRVASAIGIDEKDCVVVGRHLYIGTLPGRDVTPEQAKKDSNFRELLKHNHITGHFRDLQNTADGKKAEKMVDSDLISDALEMAFKKEFDVLVLIARDMDFVPLIEKLNKQAIDSVLFWWDIPEVSPRRSQRTAQALIDSVTYQFEMAPIADKRMKDTFESGIFRKDTSPAAFVRPAAPPLYTPADQKPPVQNYAQSAQSSPVNVLPGKVLPVSALVMDSEPRNLEISELRGTYESVIISLGSTGTFGYVKGPVGFVNPQLNNFQFGAYDIGDHDMSDFRVGTRVHFMLKPDPKRTERWGVPLYRAYNVTVV